MTTDDAHDLTAAYALDALDREEREVFRRHYADCPGCARETARHQEAATWLALAAARTPPARLKPRVLAEAARSSQLPPALQVGPVSAAADDPGHGDCASCRPPA
ncbi:zf-HC2 domain-containing protein [Streptomyces sp. S.PNR 29]|uniref:zf-HC2 domain-containing protein n=1 Tax=Streptomyces sp. S.PNR 29 TaxID=2973805 RepID=UPI0025B0FDE3|nr:zf-HC2 domain-containing protein [Streptomyces sp. S.PNR 29]MDN0199216.1 zf-HC2 domain-containing protein [Streptomyces sp. S.PNR 29]